MEDKLAELRRRLDEKTTEIEAFIARCTVPWCDGLGRA